MLYDVRLALEYDYEVPVSGGRHLVRVMPVTIPGVQRVIAASLTFSPRPAEQTETIDFFGNRVTHLVYRDRHSRLDIAMGARVEVTAAAGSDAVSPDLDALRDEIATCWSLAPNSPHHFLGTSPRLALSDAITAYAGRSAAPARSARDVAMDLCLSINRDFVYDTEATKVDTSVAEAFRLKRGVCQDFVHVMIAGLRGLGIPAGYVSGFLRTLPPPGKPKLEGADAMHAWVRAWCGAAAGWIEFDPTNAMMAGEDHIVIGYGRDYGDISPILGVLRSTGSHETSQSVDVLEVA